MEIQQVFQGSTIEEFRLQKSLLLIFNHALKAAVKDIGLPA
jgi:hypothetical protein